MKNKSVTINIEMKDDTLYIAEESSSGCKYTVRSEEELLLAACNYVADILDDKIEYEITVKKRNI